MRFRALLSTVVLAAVPAAVAWACTLCRSPTARLVRDSVLERDFGANAVAIGMPLVLLAGVVALAGRERRGGPR
ncbi:MAG TPA: hypothetical protein VIG88_07895 [Lysobacter sp.]